MKKLYNIRNTTIGIDLDKVIAFTITPESCQWERWLFIYLGIKFGEPVELRFLLCNNHPNEDMNVKIDKNVEQIYKDLIEYFNK